VGKAPHLVGKAPHLVGKAPHLVGKNGRAPKPPKTHKIQTISNYKYEQHDPVSNEEFAAIIYTLEKGRGWP